MEAFGAVIPPSFLSFSQLFVQGGNGIFISLVLFLFLLWWVFSIVWVARDISARSHALGFQVLCVLLVSVLSPLLGLPLYLVIRPLGFLYDRIPWRESAAFNLIVCYNCHTLNHKEYECCVNCGEHLKVLCKQCAKKYSHVYMYCNFCGAPNIE